MWQEFELFYGHTDARTEDGGRTDRRESRNSYLDVPNLVHPKECYCFAEKWQFHIRLSLFCIWGFEFQVFWLVIDQQANQHKVFLFTIYVFPFWPIRELETITQSFLLFKCSHISLAQSHGPKGQNDSENIPTYISTNIIGNYDIIVSNNAKIAIRCVNLG